MKRSLLVFFLTCLPAGAASYVFSEGFGSNIIGGAPPGAPSPATVDKLFTYDINDRTDLVPGVPIRVTFTVMNFPAISFQLWVQNTGTLRDTFTVTAVLGGQTASVVSSTYVSIFEATPDPNILQWQMKGGHVLTTFPGPFSLTVPWETDLTALSVKVTQDATFDGAGNGILWMGSGAPLHVTTESVPEPGTGLIATAGAAGMWRRRRPQRHRSESVLFATSS